jgi:hypothetical protein
MVVLSLSLVLFFLRIEWITIFSWNFVRSNSIIFAGEINFKIELQVLSQTKPFATYNISIWY